MHSDPAKITDAPPGEITRSKAVVDEMVREQVNRAVLKKIGRVIAEDAADQRRTRKLVAWLLALLTLAVCLMAWYGFPAVAYRIQGALSQAAPAPAPSQLSHVKG